MPITKTKHILQQFLSKSFSTNEFAKKKVVPQTHSCHGTIKTNPRFLTLKYY